jgi:hypothetical protein
MSCARATTLSVHHRRFDTAGAFSAAGDLREVCDITATIYDTLEFRILTVLNLPSGNLATPD